MEKPTYKGLPLLRKGEQMIYGDANKGCVIFLRIENYKSETSQDGSGEIIQVPDKINLQIVKITKDGMEMDTTKSYHGFYESLDVAYHWLKSRDAV